jgi:carbonic anhydrase
MHMLNLWQQVLPCVIILGIGCGGSPLLLAGEPEHQAAEPARLSPQAALERLLAGNARFVRGETSGEHRGPQRRKELTAGQHPIATILCCSDSRVPPELVFDQGLGDIFVVRVAGNVVLEDALGSVEYADVHLHTSLIVVLGHENCGAVRATLDAKFHQAHQPLHVTELAKLIMPAIKDINPQVAAAAQVHAAVEANVCQSLRQLMTIEEVAPEVKEGRLQVVGAVYDMESGKVRLLP